MCPVHPIPCPAAPRPRSAAQAERRGRPHRVPRGVEHQGEACTRRVLAAVRPDLCRQGLVRRECLPAQAVVGRMRWTCAGPALGLWDACTLRFGHSTQAKKPGSPWRAAQARMGERTCSLLLAGPCMLADQRLHDWLWQPRLARHPRARHRHQPCRPGGFMHLHGPDDGTKCRPVQYQRGLPAAICMQRLHSASNRAPSCTRHACVLCQC